MRKILIRTTAVVGGVLALTIGYVWYEFQPPAPMQAAAMAEVTLAGVTIVNPAQQRLENQRLRLSDGVIQQIEAAGDQPDPGEETARYRGAFVLPGLIDMHTHLPPDTPLNMTGFACFLYLAHGVTTIRDAGDLDSTAVPAARRGIDNGDFPGPRIFACGPFVGGAPARWANTLIIEKPEDAAPAVARIKEAGYDCVKAYDELTVEEIRAVKAAAEQHGLPVIGHVPARLGYEEALLPEVQHLFGVPEPQNLARDHIVNRIADWDDVDSTRLDLIVETTLEHGIVNTPTLVLNQQLLRYLDYEDALTDPTIRLAPRLFREVVWHPEEGVPLYRNLPDDVLARLGRAHEKKKELVRRLHEAGAALLIGTDVPQPFVVQGASVHQEMRIFNEIGMTPEEVWAIATWKAGRALGQPMLGTIQEGAPADLLIFREDPTQDLEALETLEAVIAQGRLYSREVIDATLATYQAHFDGTVFDAVSVALTRQVMRDAIQRDF